MKFTSLCFLFLFSLGNPNTIFLSYSHLAILLSLFPRHRPLFPSPTTLLSQHMLAPLKPLQKPFIGLPRPLPA